MRIMKICFISIISIFSFQFAGAQNIEYVGSYEGLGRAFDVSVVWPYAYICQYRVSPALVIIDISDPENPEFVSSLDQESASHDIEVRGNNAYLANDYLGFQILDISDPYNIYEVSSVPLPDRAYKIYVRADQAYIADGFAGLYIFDISDRENPVQIGHFDTPESAAGIIVRDDIAYVADHACILRLLNISDPENPWELGQYEGGRYARRGLALVGDYAFVPAWNHGLKIINIADPASPHLVTTFYTPGYCHDIYAKDYAYIANYTAGIQVLDIADPANPVWIGEYDTPGFSRAISVEGEYIFVTDSSSLQILKLGPNTDITGPTSPLPEKHLILKNYPNPFNSSTMINFAISEPGHVGLAIYNVAGQKVADLINEHKDTGVYNVTWNADGLASGIYLARIDAGSLSKTIKMQLLR